MKQWLKDRLGLSENENTRNVWLKERLSSLGNGLRILDAGAGELRNKALCLHLNYVSQDVCQYEGKGDSKGLQTGTWDTSKIDIVSDITNIPVEDGSFDVILCSEVFEHLVDPLKALDEFSRILKPGGILITTAPFSSLVHFAPYHFATGFSRYWYEHHYASRHFKITELKANGDWFSLLKQELLRLPVMSRLHGNRFPVFAYLLAMLGLVYFKFGGARKGAEDVACFGWHCVAVKEM